MLRLSRVAKFFGSRVLFKNLSAEFADGEIHLLVGRNGAGKSTLLRMAAGLSRPSAGELLYDPERPSMGFLGHATFLYPGLTALENLAFWQRAQGLPADRRAALDLLERVELSPFAELRAALFSRGMAQRLSLARALLGSPSLLLLDEPETGLDGASRALLEREALAARERGALVLWVSHLSASRKLADRVWELREGGLRLLEGAPC